MCLGMKLRTTEFLRAEWECHNQLVPSFPAKEVKTRELETFHDLMEVLFLTDG